VYQEKPIPRPFARANIDFFSPSSFGPEVAGLSLLGDWRLNLIGSWQAGRYATWAGGGTIPGLEYNVQWADYWNVDMRLSKISGRSRQCPVLCRCLTSSTSHSGTCGFGNYDYDSYMKSLRCRI
jgi:hypothetical protein